MIPPQRIGPYRLEDRLGAGGMGEVFRAYDERLDRRVAVKLIRPESAADHGARERFRREARAAAGLSHPAIVQIYDILQWSEGDAIVMELVEGTSLAALARATRPELLSALRLAREIAEGLAAAHAGGLLHRDLKTENVMVTAGGHAKILDFGLAKRLRPETPESPEIPEATEPSLTREHAVLGTTRAMSPEQARGLPLDQRSDLFSFGVLLYELLAGVSPFAGATPVDTLTRICTARQAPLAELVPGLPAALSALVDRLLEKDPDRRPASAGRVLAELERIDGAARQSAAGAPAAGSGEATRIEPAASGEGGGPAVGPSVGPAVGQSAPSRAFSRPAFRAGLAASVLAVAAAAVTLALLVTQVLSPVRDRRPQLGQARQGPSYG